MIGVQTAPPLATIILYYVIGVFGQDVNTLKHVSIVFRHGSRNPTITYRGDPYENYSWPDGLGALTNEGKMQMYNKGVKLRQQYSGFLSDEYREVDIHAQSSESPRAIMSGGTLLAGLYPPVERQKWNPAINWQPIPINTNSKDHDYVIVYGNKCPRFDKLYAELLVSSYVDELNEKYKSLYDTISLHINSPVSSITPVALFYDTLKVEDENKLVLPEWTKDVYPTEMQGVYATFLSLFSYTTDLKRLVGGPILNEIITKMEEKEQSELKQKMYLLFAHDLTIVTLWRVLGYDTPMTPGYGSSLAFEVHSMSDSDNLEVKINYYSSWEADATEVKIPGCDAPCSVSQFRKISENMIPQNWTEECQVPG